MYQVRNIWKTDRPRVKAVLGPAAGQLFAARAAAEELAARARAEGLPVAVVAVSLGDGLRHGAA